MFSRPVSSGWNPAPSSSSAAVRPTLRIVPLVGRRMPAMHLSSVDFARAVVPEQTDGLALVDLQA